MKILFVTTNFISKGQVSRGGLPNYLYRVSQALKKYNHTPIILTFASKRQVEYFDGIKVYSITKANNWFDNNIYMDSIQSSYFACKEVNIIIEKEEIDIVQFTSLQGLGLFYKNKVPAIVRLSSYAKIAYRDEYTYNKHEIAFLSFLERTTAKKMQGIFGPSKVTAGEFGKDIHKKIPIIETPFYTEELLWDDSSYESNLASKKYILYFGVIRIFKGVLNIADCVEKIIDKYPDYYFVFVGKNLKSEGKINIRNEILRRSGKYADHVIMLQSLPHEQLYPIIQNAQMVVLPSHMENFSNACIEAMALKKVVIGTTGASFEQLIEDGKSGFLANIDDSKNLEKKMEEVIELTTERKHEIENNAQKRIELLNPKIVVKRLLNYYKFILIKTAKI